MEIVSMQIGPGGWVRYWDGDGQATLYLRFARIASGRWVVREMYLDSAVSLTQQAMRNLPLAQCEAWANEQADRLEERYGQLDPVGDNLGILASHLGTQFQARAWARDDKRHSSWVVDAYFANASRDARAAWGFGEITPPKKRRAPAPVDPDNAERSYRLTQAPDTFPISDEFLSRVARAYRAAVLRGDRPNKTMAADVNVDVRTVERWVAKARARGFLGPARKGVAG